MDTEKQRLIKTLQDFWKNNVSKLEYVNRSVDLMRKFDDNSMFLRDCFDDGHFVSWVVVVNKEKTKVLLMHHIKLGTWQHFGWHADGEINLRDAAIRELKEEAWISQEEAPRVWIYHPNPLPWLEGFLLRLFVRISLRLYQPRNSRKPKIVGKRIRRQLIWPNARRSSQ